MSVRIVMRPAASRDVAEAYDWYEGQQAGLGQEFLNCVETALRRIAERPDGYPFVLRDAKRALVSRFPYSVYYRLRNNEARIVGVVHQNRDPRVWRRRVGP